MTEGPATGSSAFETTVDLDAPVQEVFRHLTDPVAMIRWMGQHAILEPAPGGAFEVDLEVAPANGDTVDVDLECAARGRLQGGVLAHPADHGGRVGQVPEHLLDRSVQLHGGLEGAAFSRWVLTHRAGSRRRP